MASLVSTTNSVSGTLSVPIPVISQAARSQMVLADSKIMPVAPESEVVAQVHPEDKGDSESDSGVSCQDISAGWCPSNRASLEQFPPAAATSSESAQSPTRNDQPDCPPLAPLQTEDTSGTWATYARFMASRRALALYQYSRRCQSAATAAMLAASRLRSQCHQPGLAYVEASQWPRQLIEPGSLPTQQFPNHEA